MDLRVFASFFLVSFFVFVATTADLPAEDNFATIRDLYYNRCRQGILDDKALEHLNNHYHHFIAVFHNSSQLILINKVEAYCKTEKDHLLQSLNALLFDFELCISKDEYDLPRSIYERFESYADMPCGLIRNKRSENDLQSGYNSFDKSDDEAKCKLALNRYQADIDKCITRKLRPYYGLGYTSIRELCDDISDRAMECFSEYVDGYCRHLEGYGKIKRFYLDLIKMECFSSGSHRITSHNILIFALFALIIFKGFISYD